MEHKSNLNEQVRELVGNYLGSCESPIQNEKHIVAIADRFGVPASHVRKLYNEIFESIATKN
jgi:hypothetical protein